MAIKGQDNTGWILETDGSKREVQPSNGSAFTMEEVYKLIGAETIEARYCSEDMMILMDEDGKRKGQPINYQATLLLESILSKHDFVVGPVLYCSKELFK